MKIGGNQGANELNVSLENRRLEEVETYRYLGGDVSVMVECMRNCVIE